MRRRTVVLLAALALRLTAQGPLAPPAAPAENPTTPAKALLGKVLFWDEQLSSDGRVACGTCHRPDAGGADPRRQRHPGRDGQWQTGDDTFGSPGVAARDWLGQLVAEPRFGTAPQVTSRAALGVTTAAWFPELFWDGRRGGTFVDPETQTVAIAQGGALEAQALHPLVDPVEMARPGRSWAEVRARLAAVRPLALATDLPADVQAGLAAAPTYPALFQAAFGDPAITTRRLAFALAAYLRTLVPDQTPWDQFQRGNPSALSPDQQAGLGWFRNEARCHICHPPGLFSDAQFRGLGLVPVAQDPGRGGVTGLPQDLGAFRVPSLRNAALKSTFMHNGRFTTLTQVVGFYRNGGGSAGPRDPELALLSIDPVQTQQLLDFLQNGLVDPRVRQQLPPFDRPTLWSERVPAAGNLYGGAAAWAGGTPALLADAVPFLGQPELALGAASLPPGGTALLLLGLARAPAGALVAAAPLHVDLAAPHAVWSLPVPAGGLVSWTLPVPAAPILAGLPLFAQVFATVPGSSAAAATRGADLRLR